MQVLISARHSENCDRDGAISISGKGDADLGTICILLTLETKASHNFPQQLHVDVTKDPGDN